MNRYTAPYAVFPGLFEAVQMNGIFPFALFFQIKYGLSEIKKLRYPLKKCWYFERQGFEGIPFFFTSHLTSAPLPKDLKITCLHDKT
ncbi:MAG: hypothetical protein EPO28_12670 [Saprospiraceae bacterium]|nr:MAG: hypothetical protein EPO28_12670 [Saprospiraceae bacterium]